MRSAIAQEIIQHFDGVQIMLSTAACKEIICCVSFLNFFMPLSAVGTLFLPFKKEEG